VLDVPLDIVVAKKIGAPGNPEFAIGAVAASDGSVWQNETAFRGTGGDEEYFEQQREEEAANARQKAERYRDDQAEPDLTDETVVVVDDGVATGSTVRACLKKLQGSDADRIVLAQYRSVRRTPSTNSRRRPTRSSASRRRGTSGASGSFTRTSGRCPTRRRWRISSGNRKRTRTAVDSSNPGITTSIL